MALRARRGRRIGACSDLALSSGTLFSSARSILPSRGGGYGGQRGARTHLTSFSFTVSRCGAPSISVTSVPLVPPSARSASLRASWAVVGADALIGPLRRPSSTTGQRQRKEAQDVSLTSPGQKSSQGQRVSVSDCRKGQPTFPRRRQEGCASADRPAEAFFLFGPCNCAAVGGFAAYGCGIPLAGTARFSFGKTKREMGGALPSHQHG